jgi:HPt (histidine-containing phosphotransfer) domain-containing protein
MPVDLDHARLDLLRTLAGSDPAWLQRLAQSFDETATRERTHLRSAATVAEIRASAHRLKGAAANLGAVGTASIAQRLIALADAAQPLHDDPPTPQMHRAVDDLLDQLGAEVDAVAKALVGS